SMGHARAIVSVENEDDQMKIYETIIAKDLSVRQVEDAVRKLRQAETETSGTKTATPTLPEKYVEVQENLSERLESEVSLSRSKRGKGKIVIPFKNDKDFERILSLLNN